MPFSVRAIDILKKEFEKDFRRFDVFTLLRADTIKWLELEKAIARAMTNFKAPTPLGERWCFLKGSFVADVSSNLALSPQIVPQVKRRGKTLDLENLKSWAASRTRETPPQKTMNPNDWPALYEKLDKYRTILPVDKSRSADCMFKFVDALLCFQAKSVAQDLSIKKLKKEIAKCPFLTLSKVTAILSHFKPFFNCNLHSYFNFNFHC